MNIDLKNVRYAYKDTIRFDLCFTDVKITMVNCSYKIEEKKLGYPRGVQFDHEVIRKSVINKLSSFDLPNYIKIH
jgi:hypothetical protein